MLAKKCIKIYDLVLANDRKNILVQVLKLKTTRSKLFGKLNLENFLDLYNKK